LNVGEVERIINCSEMLFVYAITWSIGGNVDDESRGTFSHIMTDIFTEFNQKLITESKTMLPSIDMNTSYYN